MPGSNHASGVRAHVCVRMCVHTCACVHPRVCVCACSAAALVRAEAPVLDARAVWSEGQEGMASGEGAHDLRELDAVTLSLQAGG